MRTALLVLVFSLTVNLLSGQTPESYSRVTVLLNGRSIQQLAALGIETDHGILRPGYSLTTDLSASEIEQVKKAGFLTEIIIDDVIAWYADPQRKSTSANSRGENCSGYNPSPYYATPVNYTYGSMGGYQTLAEIEAVLDDMHAKFPNLITLRKPISDTLKTIEGRPIWYVKLSDKAAINEAEPEVLYTAMHHCREPNGMSQMLFFMWYLLENYATDPQVKYIVDNTELFFIPCINPDGYVYNETQSPNGGGLWRKNRSVNANGSFGTDLNRNYGFQWGFDNIGSSPNPGSDTYRGSSGFSELETQMMRDFCVQHDFISTLNYHTFSNLLIYPWAYNNTLADSSFYFLGHLMTEYNNYKTGTTLETVGYAVNGSSDDWMYAETGTLVFTPEVGSTGFWPSFDEIEGLNRENVWPNLANALAALNFYVSKAVQPKFVNVPGFKLPVSVRRYGLEDGTVTVSAQPTSANIFSVSGPKTLALKAFKDSLITFDVELLPSALPGDSVRLELLTDNGAYSTLETVIMLVGGNFIPVFTENASAGTEWTGSWGQSKQIYVSAPSSFTDSPNGSYPANSFTSYSTINSVKLPADAISAQLKFYARWETEYNYDFAQAFIIPQGSADRIPLCGRYTRTPGQGDFAGQPVYDGIQTSWVEENIDLSDYLGQSFKIGFQLYSDQAITLDGFYFDDLSIEFLKKNSVGTVSIPVNAFSLLQVQPNPTTDRTLFSWISSESGDSASELLIFNSLGRLVYRKNVNAPGRNQASLNLAELPSGVYFWRLNGSAGQSESRRFIKQ